MNPSGRNSQSLQESQLEIFRNTGTDPLIHESPSREQANSDIETAVAGQSTENRRNIRTSVSHDEESSNVQAPASDTTTETPEEEVEVIFPPQVTEDPYERIKYPVPLPQFLDQYELLEGIANKKSGVYFSKKRRKIDRVISSRHCQEEDHNEKNEGTYLFAVMLTLKAAEQVKWTNMYNPKQNNNGGIKQKYYDRLVTFADGMSPGRCFAYVFATKPNARDFFEYGNKNFGVGTPFLIKEVNSTQNTLGKSQHCMPLMEGGSNCAIPLNKVMMRHVPSCPLMLPPEEGATQYFCYHKVKDLKVSCVQMVTPPCGGRLCDRQVEPPGTKEWPCGCFHANIKAVNWVMKMNVYIPCETTVSVTGKIGILNFRSIQTTELFIHPSSFRFWEPRSSTMINDLRDTVQDIVEYVNKNGGWTIIGWVKNGPTTDDSDVRDKETMAGDNVIPHLTYMMPSHLEILQNQTYEAKIYTATADLPEEIGTTSEDSGNEAET